MKKILGEEGVDFDLSGLELLSQYAKGSLRDGLSLLDQAIAQGDGKVEVNSVKSMLGVVDESLVRALLEFVIDKKANELVQLIDEVERWELLLLLFSMRWLRYCKNCHFLHSLHKG
jgi:DNA polymerase-3 subunit gamma/tau